jgi:hypothetical protein
MVFSFRGCASCDRTIPEIDRNVCRLNQAKAESSERYVFIEHSSLFVGCVQDSRPPLRGVSTTWRIRWWICVAQ